MPILKDLVAVDCGSRHRSQGAWWVCGWLGAWRIRRHKRWAWWMCHWLRGALWICGWLGAWRIRHRKR